MKSKTHSLLWLVHPAALLPLALLAWDYFTNQLSFNPIQDITHRTGYAAIVLLILSLAITPINSVFGWKSLVPLRKPLGLYAFLYVCLHLLTFSVLDYGLDWALISAEVAEKRYVLVGVAAFLLLLPLAVTSTKGWQKRLGKNWKRLHYAVYAAAALSVLHYVWLSKDPRQPLLFGVIIAMLLFFRLPPIRRTISQIRSKIATPKRPAIIKSTPDTH